jgi:hypothetical protein
MIQGVGGDFIGWGGGVGVCSLWVFAQRLLACGGLSCACRFLDCFRPCWGEAGLTPSPLRGEGWDEGRVLRRSSLVFVLAWSPGCSPAAGFRWPAGQRVPSLCWPKEKEPREMACRARRPYKPYRLGRFGTGATPPVRRAATPRRRRQLRLGRGCCNLPCLACSSVAEALHSCLVVLFPSPSSRRRPGSSSRSGRFSRPPPTDATGFRPAPE